MSKWWVWAAALSIVAGGAVAARAQTYAPAPPPPPSIRAEPGPSGEEARPFGFSRIVVRLPLGVVYLYPHGGVFCLPSRQMTWQTSGDVRQQPTPFQTALREEMKPAGYRIDGDPDNLFDSSASTSDIQLAAIITSMSANYCQPRIGFGDNALKGQITMSVTWEVYSTIQKQILAKVDTTGSAQLAEVSPGGLTTLVIAGFRDNVRGLIAAPAFRKAVTGAPDLGGDLLKPAPQAPIALTGAVAARARGVNEAVSAVALILAGDSQGSGFLVSADGLLLTDRHVVGDAKYVKIRWSNGEEGLGEVIRTDKVRDVALVKADPRGRAPIRIRRDALQPGDTVFAVGAPLDQKFQSTITRGVVSAYRKFGGLNFVQSDASVNPGSSGGPLLDDKGEAIGATESGYFVSGAPTNINLFVPIGDALDFLSATEK